MRILMHATPYLEGCTTREEKIRALAEVLSAEYNEAVSDPDAYLAIDYIEDENVCFGSDDAKGILDAAGTWNERLRNNLRSAVISYIDAFRRVDDPSSCESLNTTDTYALKKAAMAADNDFYTFAEEALLIPRQETGALYFRTVLEPADLKLIHTVPQEFVLLEIPVK